MVDADTFANSREATEPRVGEKMQM